MDLTKCDDFAICFDIGSEDRYIKKIKDEMTKKHKDPEHCEWIHARESR